MRPVLGFLLMFAWPAAAGEMLPLKRGIYVDTRAACKGASRADTLSYWGGDNGINVGSRPAPLAPHRSVRTRWPPG